MSQGAHVVVHRPGDVIFVMNEDGKVTAFEVERDGHLNPVDPGTAVARTSIEQNRDRENIQW